MSTLRNDLLMQSLAGEFQRRREPNFAWVNLASALQALPGLVGAWAMTAIDKSNGNQADISGNVRTLTYNGNANYDFDSLMPFLTMNGATYLSRLNEAQLDIQGNEAVIASARLGLTLGGWFQFRAAAAAAETMIGKWDAAGNQRSYRLIRAATGIPQADISTNGTAVVSVVSSVGVLDLNTWYFVAMRFDTSSELAIWVNSTKTTNTAGIPSTLYNSTANFYLGASQAVDIFGTGRLGPCFLSTMALSDALVMSLYEQTKSLAGVK